MVWLVGLMGLRTTELWPWGGVRWLYWAQGLTLFILKTIKRWRNECAAAAFSSVSYCLEHRRKLRISLNGIA